MATNDFVVKNGLDVTENAIIRETTDSSDKDTGALVVEGGVGIEKKLYVGTDLAVGGTTALTGNATLTGDIAVNGGDITTNQTTFNLIETTATTLNIGGAATTLNVGASSGTTNVRNNLNVVGDLDIDGSDLTSSTTTFNLINTTATTLNIGGAATALNLGAATGALTVNNARTVFNSTNSIQLPVGNISQRSGSPTQGQIRYNSELSLYEGYGAGNQWNSLGGVRDVDGDTYILAELTPAANNNTLYFYAGGTNSLSLTASVLDVKSGTTLSVANATDASSSSPLSGAVQIAGGVSIAKRLYAGSIENTPIGTSVRNTALFTTLGVNGQVTFNAGTASTTTGTGSLIVTGGVGISGAINAGASSTLAGLSSTSTTVLSPANASVTISPTGTGNVVIAPATLGSINNMSIGATTASTGAFTTLTASSTVTLSPANATVTISPTGTGTLTVAPATTGTINNVSIGATTASTGRFTTVTSTQATGTAPFTVASTTVVTNLNADLLDGFNSAQASTVSTVAVRDASGDIVVRLVRSEFADQATISGAMAFRVNNSTDNYIRFVSDKPAIRTFLDVPTRTGGDATGTWAISVSGNAATATALSNDAPFLRSRGTIAEASLNSAVSNGFYTVSMTGQSSSLLTWNAAGSTGPVQIDVRYSDEIRYRNQTDSSTWNNWKTFLHSANYNTYSPTLAGVGATGTWAIAISGNAATVTNGVYTTGNQSIGGNKTFTGTTTLATTDVNTSSSLSFGSATRQMVNLWSTSYGIGVQSSTTYFRSASRFSWHRGGAHNETENNPGGGTVAMTLDGSSNLTVTGTITEQSSIRYKENVKPIDNALEKVLQLQGVTYDRKDGTAKNESGMIAEEVAKVIPNLVSYNDEGMVDGIHYSKTVAYLVECIKELNAKIERLEGKQ